jgi:hypothetical protein
MYKNRQFKQCDFVGRNFDICENIIPIFRTFLLHFVTLLKNLYKLKNIFSTLKSRGSARIRVFRFSQCFSVDFVLYDWLRTSLDAKCDAHFCVLAVRCQIEKISDKDLVESLSSWTYFDARTKHSFIFHILISRVTR